TSDVVAYCYTRPSIVSNRQTSAGCASCGIRVQLIAVNANEKSDDSGGRSWPLRLMAQMGANVAAHRRRRGLTGDELVELCNRGGYPLTRAVLANIEKGRGKSSGPTVAELLVIARALNVAPVRLLADPDEDDTLEVTPGEHMPTWDAWRWIGGGDDQHADLHRRWEQALNRMEDASVRITAGSAPE